MLFFRKSFKYKFFNATIGLIAINSIFFVITTTFPRLELFFGLNPFLFWYNKMYWQPLTYMFVHSSLMHIIFNMFALVFFGISVEKALGSKEFLLMYFVCGVFCGLLSLVVYIYLGLNVLLVGASGAVYAMLLTFAVIYPNSKIYIWGILPIPSPILVLAYAIMEFLSQLTGSRDSTAHIAHLAGFAVAWAYLVVRMGIHPIRVWKNAFRS